jgi:Ran GTPase-activating protein (RanGAP) involved in mRNA processing and transport
MGRYKKYRIKNVTRNLLTVIFQSIEMLTAVCKLYANGVNEEGVKFL